MHKMEINELFEAAEAKVLLIPADKQNSVLVRCTDNFEEANLAFSVVSLTSKGTIVKYVCQVFVMEVYNLKKR